MFIVTVTQMLPLFLPGPVYVARLPVGGQRMTLMRLCERAGVACRARLATAATEVRLSYTPQRKAAWRLWGPVIRWVCSRRSLSSAHEHSTARGPEAGKAPRRVLYREADCRGDALGRRRGGSKTSVLIG